MALACSLIFWLAGPSLIALLTTIPEVRQEALVYLAWAAFIPISGMLAFQMDGVFIGATWSRDMSIMMIVSLIGYLCVWWLVKDSMANHGLWLALHSFVIFRGLTLSARLMPKVRQTFTA